MPEYLVNIDFVISETHCGVMLNVTGATFDNEIKDVVDSVGKYICNDDLRFSTGLSEATIICQENGNWSSFTDSCLSMCDICSIETLNLHWTKAFSFSCICLSAT